MRAFTSASSRISPLALLTKIAIGTPQARWRDSTQSGRPSTMPPMRFLPDGGYHSCVRSRPWRAGAAYRSQIANRLVHGGKPLRRGAEDHRRLGTPAMRILMAQRALGEQFAGRDQLLDHRTIGVAILAVRRRGCACPRTAEHWAKKLSSSRADASGFSRDSRELSVTSSKSSSPCPGALWTKPVPVSAVTCSPGRTGTSKSITLAAQGMGCDQCPRDRHRARRFRTIFACFPSAPPARRPSSSCSPACGKRAFARLRRPRTAP